jgi:hypothetical protein
MRKLVPVAVVLSLACAAVALAGERVLNAGCQVTSNGSVGSTASDATDCTFGEGRWYMFQCDQPVYYRTDGTDPTSTSPRVNFPGDPYPFVARRATSSTVHPLKVLNVSAAATCNVYEADTSFVADPGWL